MKRGIMDKLGGNSKAATPRGVGDTLRAGLQLFCLLASLRLGQVAGYLPSPRLSSKQNGVQFHIPWFFNSLLAAC